MKKQTILTAALSVLLLVGTSDKSLAQKGGKFSSFNAEKDELGITGEYSGLKDKRDFGFRFVKEADGKLVNEMHYFEKKGNEPQLKLNLKESFFNKNKVKVFYKQTGGSASSYVELIEIDPGVLAQISTNYNNNGNCVPPDAQRTVVDVYAKNKASLTTWDIETAQAKVEMIMNTLNSEKMEKVKASLMNFDSYKNYKGKIAFAKGSHIFRNTRSNEPVEKLEWFVTKAEMGSKLGYKPYFEQPLIISHPGAWFNVTYELLGETTDREKLRKSSTFFSKNIPQIDKYKDEFYMPGRALTDDNGADYAYLEVLRLVKGKIKEGGVYDLKVTVWAFKDGENIAPVASGVLQLEYTKGENGSKKLLMDPTSGWIPKMEKWMDE
jgi:hypothetical protein